MVCVVAFYKIICRDRVPISLTFLSYISQADQLLLFVFFISYICKYLQSRLIAWERGGGCLSFNLSKMTSHIFKGIDWATIQGYYFTLHGLYIIPLLLSHLRSTSLLWLPLPLTQLKKYVQRRKCQLAYYTTIHFLSKVEIRLHLSWKKLEGPPSGTEKQPKNSLPPNIRKSLSNRKVYIIKTSRCWSPEVKNKVLRSIDKGTKLRFFNSPSALLTLLKIFQNGKTFNEHCRKRNIATNIHFWVLSICQFL